MGRTLPWVYSAGLHALLIVLLSVSFKLHTRPASAPASTAIAVQATVVDEARIQKEMADLEAAERRRAQEQQRQAQRAEAARTHVADHALVRPVHALPQPDRRPGHAGAPA